MSLVTISSESVRDAAVTRARIQVPSYNRWWADVDLQSEVTLSGLVTLSVGDTDFVGSIVSGGPYAGRSFYRIVSGYGGWANTLLAKSYRDSAGVSVASVIGDAAFEVGETVSSPPADRLGEHFARCAGPASSVLNILTSSGWYVDYSGVTRFGAREETRYDRDTPIVDNGPHVQFLELAPEDLTGVVPGMVVGDNAPATDIEILIEGSRLSVRVYCGMSLPRDLVAFKKILDAIDPDRAYRCAYNCRVVSQAGDALNLQPVRSSTSLPDLEGVPVRLPPGVKCTHLPGSLVTVLFLDGDPSQPVVVTGDSAGSPGWMPLFLEFGDGAIGVARLGDTVLAGGYAGVITSASARVKAGS